MTRKPYVLHSLSSCVECGASGDDFASPNIECWETLGDLVCETSASTNSAIAARGFALGEMAKISKGLEVSETGNEGGTEKLRGGVSPTISTTGRSPGVPRGFAFTERQKAMNGYVYFLVGEDSGHFKIGLAMDPVKRLRGVQTGCPERLDIFGVLPSRNPRKLEQKIHQRFAHLRLRGEWFRDPDGEIDNFVLTYCYELTIDGVPLQRIWDGIKDGPAPKLKLRLRTKPRPHEFSVRFRATG